MGKIAADRNIFFDLLRVAAMVAVVFGHTVANFVDQYYAIPLSSWMTANIVDSSIRFCVPLFVMISGALLLAKERGYADFYKKRASKILLPLVFWTLFYTLWSVCISRGQLSWQAALGQMLSGNAYYHLWFVYMIFGLYLISPFLQKMLKNFSGSDYKWLLSLWVLFGIAIPIFPKIVEYLFAQKTFISYGLPSILGFAGYYVLGHYLSGWTDKIKARIWLILYVAAAFITAAGTYLLTRRLGLDEYLYGFFAPNVFVETIAIYFIFKKICGDINWENHSKQKKFIQTVSDLSFGIYLVHPIPLGILSFVARSVGFVNLAIYIPTIGMTTLILSIAICFLMKKIPIAKKLI